MLGNLLGDRPIPYYVKHAKTLISQRLAKMVIALRLCRLIMMRAVNEYADARNAVALVIKIRLNGDTICRSMLRVIGQTQFVLVEIIEEGSFEARRGIDESQQAMILLLVACFVGNRRNLTLR